MPKDRLSGLLSAILNNYATNCVRGGKWLYGAKISLNQKTTGYVSYMMQYRLIFAIMHHICFIMITLQTIAQSVKSVRKAKGLSQSELSRRADVSRAQIDRLENGRTSDVGFLTLIRILRALGLDLSLGPMNYGRPTLSNLAEAQRERDSAYD